MKLKYTLDFDRIAVVKVGNQIHKVGDITDFYQHTDGLIKVTLEFDPLLNKQMREDIEKAPHMVGIQSSPKPCVGQVVLP